MYQTIIVPLDGGPRSEEAVPIAARLARAGGAALELVRVHRTQRPDLDQNPAWAEAIRQEERDSLAAVADKYESMVGRPIATALLEVPIVKALCDHAAGCRAPLVVMTVRGVTGFRRALLGSVSDGLVRHGNIPVLVLRRRRSDGRLPTWKRSSAPFHNVVVPLDGTALAEGGLAHAIAMARLTGATIHLIRVVTPVTVGAVVGALPVYALPPVDDWAMTRDDLASAYLEGVADRANAAGGRLAITTEVALAAEPGSAIAESCRRNAADLVVMATHGRGGSRLIFGAVADRVLRSGPDAILFVRPSEVSLPAGLRNGESHFH